MNYIMIQVFAQIHVPQKYIDMYSENEEIPNPNFYGMITNIDENLGLLRNKLEEHRYDWRGQIFARPLLSFRRNPGHSDLFSPDWFLHPVRG